MFKMLLAAAVVVGSYSLAMAQAGSGGGTSGAGGAVSTPQTGSGGEAMQAHR